MKKVVFSLFLITVFSGLSYSQSHLITIPGSYSTIQAGINKAVNGDTVLVSPGIYYENINFRGKKIVVASNYIIAHDVNTISTTIIDGSKTAMYPDTASCVIFESREDSSSVLEGFTITNGKGTLARYPVDNTQFFQGGGIVIIHSSPTIKNNIITNNGFPRGQLNGGGIGINDHSNPKIIKNLIQYNTGSFGGGISLWENSAAIIKNNIICYNSGGHIYGGAGIATDQSKAIFENNTIVYNVANGTGGTGGAMVIWSATAQSGPKIVNNIFWGNKQISGGPVSLIGASVVITNSVVEGGFPGNGNIDKDPLLTGAGFLLSNNSPCIDAGDTGSKYNDREDALKPGFAMMPSKGGIRNDIGAYGGPFANTISTYKFSRIGMTSTNILFGIKNIVGVTVVKKLILLNQSSETGIIDSVVVKNQKESLKINYFPATLNPQQTDSIQVKWTPVDNLQFKDSVFIYHKGKGNENPIKISVTGKASLPVSVESEKMGEYILNYPNPFDEVTTIKYSIPENSASLIIYDVSETIIKTYNGINGSGSIQFDGRGLPNGIYFNKLITSNKNGLTNKMIILR